MAIDTSNYLDFYHIIRNELIGDTVLFIIFSYVVSNYYMAKAKVSPTLVIIVNVLLSGLLFELTRNITIYSLTLIVVGIIVYTGYNKLIKR